MFLNPSKISSNSCGKAVLTNINCVYGVIEGKIYIYMYTHFVNLKLGVGLIYLFIIYLKVASLYYAILLVFIGY